MSPKQTIDLIRLEVERLSYQLDAYRYILTEYLEWVENDKLKDKLSEEMQLLVEEVVKFRDPENVKRVASILFTKRTIKYGI